MGFFGMSSAGKNAQSKLSDIAGTQYGQAKTDWGNGNDMYTQAQGNDPSSYYKWMVQNGFNGGDPSAVTNGANDWKGYTGANSIMQQNGANLDKVQGIYNGLPTAASVGTNLSGNTADQNDQQTKRIAGEFGAARGKSSDLFGNQTVATGDTFKHARDLVGTKMDYANGTTARAFAPAKAAALQSLRASGVDPNSPEGQAAMARINSQQGAAFDNNQSQNIDQMNSLNLGELGQKNQLGQQGLANDQQLAGQQFGAETNQGNLNYGNKQNDIMTGYGLQTSEADRNANLLREQNQNNLVDLGINNQGYQEGVNAQARDNATRAAGTQGLNNLYNSQNQFAQGWTGQGNGLSNQASQGYQNIYNTESANAGWGLKALGGLAGGALNLVAPGAGSMLTGAMGGATGGGGSSPWDLSKFKSYNPMGNVNMSNVNQQGGSSGWA